VRALGAPDQLDDAVAGAIARSRAGADQCSIRRGSAISDDATLGLPLSVPQRSAADSRFESSLPIWRLEINVGR
jgi:hypothetical protein